jgi:hypothetical protein
MNCTAVISVAAEKIYNGYYNTVNYSVNKVIKWPLKMRILRVLYRC